MSALAFTIAVHAAVAHLPDATGGGWTDNGILGRYFANPGLEGEPAFIRRDVRLDFDWGPGAPVGGSRAKPYAEFPKSRFSVRWEGRILPRFSEAYVFEGRAGGGLRVSLRSPDGKKRLIVDRWNESGPWRSKPVPLKRGKAVDVVIEYRQLAASGALRLRWSSPSTPEEIIDPVAQQGLNAATYGRIVWADALKTARWSNDEGFSDQQWPLEDAASLVLMETEGAEGYGRGTYRISFRGRADVSQNCCCRNFAFVQDGGARTKRLPEGAYDPKTDRTEGKFAADCSRVFIQFERESAQDEDGPLLTDLQVMRPLHPGADTPHRTDEVVTRYFKDIVRDHYTSIRWLGGGNRKGEVSWSDRTHPDFPFFYDADRVENWELLIMLANETGKDLLIATPISADDAYFEKLARLAAFGSDGREPYRERTPNPRYPPLNSNLRIYVEVGNEIWNWPFPSTQEARRLSMAAKETELWSVMNFDGTLGDPGNIDSIRRWHALRTLAASRAFREVMGDEAMGERFRPLIEYQYENLQRTAEISFDFLDSLLWHQAEQRGEDPVPVSHWIWGAGGATYFALQNGRGVVEEPAFADGGFEGPLLPEPGVSLQPSGVDGWRFEGAAGVARLDGRDPDGPLEVVPEPKEGIQAGILLSGGRMSQELNFEEPGHYAISFRAAGKKKGWPRYLPFRVAVDGENISARDQGQMFRSSGSCDIGGWRRSTDKFDGYYGSAVFEVKAPGPRRISFTAEQVDGPGWIMIDEVGVTKAEAIVESGFAQGEALGQSGADLIERQFAEQAIYAKSFGLPVVAYEAGWSVGGDFSRVPIQNWTKSTLPEVGKLHQRVDDIWHQTGGFMSIWGVYEFFPWREPLGARDRPLMKALRQTSRRLPPEQKIGSPLPAELTPKEADWNFRRSGSGSLWDRLFGDSRQWWSWIVNVPKTGVYAVTVEGSGQLRVELDGEVILTGEQRSKERRLTRGAHAIRLVPESGGEVTSVSVKAR